ncbi:RNA 2',3'-cyclic phosphodiesterase [Candidatus Pacearchaeota archaeon]|nr:RNA 2',3'-cyclic phosphodiesterase [Candidatus Pacearchaeota archaeon]
MRTFISIELPEKIRKRIFRLSKKVRDSGCVSGSFVSKDNIHLTLRFLGNLTGKQISQVKDALSDLALPKFRAQTGKIGFFPSENYVKVIWVDFVSDDVVRLKGLIENKLQKVGINKERKDFEPHITFARIRKVSDKPKFLEIIKDMDLRKMDVEVDKIHLRKSELTNDGPIYKTLGEFSLM